MRNHALRQAWCFLFPSRYEGFGLPTLEALANGTPTVLADASCSREVGQDLAEYFSPGEVGECVAAVRRATSDSALSRVRQDGPVFAAGFTWEEVARKTAELYLKVIQ